MSLWYYQCMKYPRHLLQSKEWALFREQWGTKVIDLGKTRFTVHNIPHLPWNIGYMPRPYPEEIDWELLRKRAKEENCIYVKIEPNSENFTPPKNITVVKGERMFAYATYLIDLSASEDELLRHMHPKTRYNINLAKRKGVTIQVGHSDENFAEFMKLYHDTEKRQGMFLHPDKYYKMIFDVFKKAGNVEIITGYYNTIPLASIMVIKHEHTLFYPYGGSTHVHKEVMAYYLIMWEAILYGKKMNCKFFDMWNCLPPGIEDPSHPWYGFHKFKKGFHGELIRFPGAYDVVFVPKIYPLIILLNKTRWAFLKTGKYLKKLINR